jgi:hypothetical protein
MVAMKNRMPPNRGAISYFRRRFRSALEGRSVADQIKTARDQEGCEREERNKKQYKIDHHGLILPGPVHSANRGEAQLVPAVEGRIDKRRPDKMRGASGCRPAPDFDSQLTSRGLNSGGSPCFGPHTSHSTDKSYFSANWISPQGSLSR